MKRQKIFQIWLIFIIFLVCSLLTLIPYEKYQERYMNFIHDFNSVPQKHYEKQLEIAKMHMEGTEDKKDEKEEGPKKEDYKQPYFIRDRKNRHILHRIKRN